MSRPVNQLPGQQPRYYGKYRGFVVDNDDPQQRARVKLRIPSVLGEDVSNWALPCLPFGGLDNQGLFLVPEVDSQLWVEFEEGNVDLPIWVGTFWQQAGDPPDEAAKSPPTTRLLRTPGGHLLQFDDESGSERVMLAHANGAQLEIDENGKLLLSDSGYARLTLDADGRRAVLEDDAGNTLTMDQTGTVIEDANGNQVEMAPAGITVKGTQIVIDGAQVAVGGQGGEPLIKGQSFLSLFATHVHTCAAPGGPTSPPIPQGEFATLTTKTTAS